jgi:integrating conjugative element protein (TIGR03757 family)
MSPFNHAHAAYAQTLKTYLAGLTSLLICTTALAEPVLITTNQYLIPTTKDIRTINLDLPDILESEISAHLPTNPEKAYAIITQRLTPELTGQLTQAHQNVTDAWSMGVTKVPAVVVDRKYVVYGETNVQRALDRINDYRKTEP